MNLFDMKLEIMNADEIRETIKGLQERVNTDGMRVSERAAANKLITKAEAKLKELVSMDQRNSKVNPNDPRYAKQMSRIKDVNNYTPQRPWTRYTLRHLHEIVENPVSFHALAVPDVVELTVAYAQFKADEIHHGFDLSHQALVPMLVSTAVGGYIEPNPNYAMPVEYEIDMYVNWEEWAPLAGEVLRMERFTTNEAFNKAIVDHVLSQTLMPRTSEVD